MRSWLEFGTFSLSALDRFPPTDMSAGEYIFDFAVVVMGVSDWSFIVVPCHSSLPLALDVFRKETVNQLPHCPSPIHLAVCLAFGHLVQDTISYYESLYAQALFQIGNTVTSNSTQEVVHEEVQYNGAQREISECSVGESACDGNARGQDDIPLWGHLLEFILVLGVDL